MGQLPAPPGRGGALAFASVALLVQLVQLAQQRAAVVAAEQQRQQQPRQQRFPVRARGRWTRRRHRALPSNASRPSQRRTSVRRASFSRRSASGVALK